MVVDMMSASQVLSEIEAYELSPAAPVGPQLQAMAGSCQMILHNCGLVVDDALQAAFREVCSKAIIFLLQKTFFCCQEKINSLIISR